MGCQIELTRLVRVHAQAMDMLDTVERHGLGVCRPPRRAKEAGHDQAQTGRYAKPGEGASALSCGHECRIAVAHRNHSAFLCVSAQASARRLASSTCAGVISAARASCSAWASF